MSQDELEVRFLEFSEMYAPDKRFSDMQAPELRMFTASTMDDVEEAQLQVRSRPLRRGTRTSSRMQMLSLATTSGRSTHRQRYSSGVSGLHMKSLTPMVLADTLTRQKMYPAEAAIGVK